MKIQFMSGPEYPAKFAMLRPRGSEPLTKPPMRGARRPFPVLHLKHMKKLDLTGFNFDGLLP
jgi:hypothetical protein